MPGDSRAPDPNASAHRACSSADRCSAAALAQPSGPPRRPEPKPGSWPPGRPAAPPPLGAPPPGAAPACGGGANAAPGMLIGGASGPPSGLRLLCSTMRGAAIALVCGACSCAGEIARGGPGCGAGAGGVSGAGVGEGFGEGAGVGA
jgi:translation initiation factor IF-2